MFSRNISNTTKEAVERAILVDTLAQVRAADHVPYQHVSAG